MDLSLYNAMEKYSARNINDAPFFNKTRRYLFVKNFWTKNILSPKNMLDPKIFGSKKVWVGKKEF